MELFARGPVGPSRTDGLYDVFRFSRVQRQLSGQEVKKEEKEGEEEEEKEEQEEEASEFFLASPIFF